MAAGWQQDGVPVGSRGREVRLHSRSAGAPVRLRLGGLNFGPCALSSDTGDCAQIQENWSSGTGSTIGTGKRNISHLFSSGEENSGRVARLPRCSSRERSAPSRALQDGGPVDRAPADPARRLVNNFGHHRSLPSPPHSSRATAVFFVWSGKEFTTSTGRCASVWHRHRVFSRKS